MIYTLLIALVVISILSQVPNIYYIFREYNSFNNWIKPVQSSVFCGILSLAILYCALTDQHEYAAGGALIEAALNISYYGKSFRNSTDIKDDDGKVKNWAKLKKYWEGYLLAVLQPALIWFCAWQLTIW